jgi:hypothetical protein
MTKGKWICDECEKEIPDDKGAVTYLYDEGFQFVELLKGWEKARRGSDGELGLISMQDLDEYPSLVKWHTWHYKCKNPVKTYSIDVSELRDPWDIIRWTAHLYESKGQWMGHTDWPFVLYRIMRDVAQ